MPISLKAAAVVTAISVGALGLLNLPGGAADRQDDTRTALERRPGEVESSPPARGGRRTLELPLQHAILRDDKDKKEDSAEAAIIEALTKPTTVEFLELPLEDCLSFLKEYHKLNIWIDRHAVTDEGVALDTPITLKLADVSFES